jgi:hypothetical protein
MNRTPHPGIFAEGLSAPYPLYPNQGKQLEVTGKSSGTIKEKNENINPLLQGAGCRAPCPTPVLAAPPSPNVA